MLRKREWGRPAVTDAEEDRKGRWRGVGIGDCGDVGDVLDLLLLRDEVCLGGELDGGWWGGFGCEGGEDGGGEEGFGLGVGCVVLAEEGGVDAEIEAYDTP